MSTCRLYREMLKDRIGGTAMDEDALRAHLAACPECRRLARLHELLEQETAPSALPPEEKFGQMREAVRRRILATPGNRRFRLRPPLFPFPSGLRAAATAGLLLIFAAGSFFAGRWTSPRAESVPSRLVKELSWDAARKGMLGDRGSSHYLLNNVSLRELEDGRLDIGFDVTTRVRVKEESNSPLVRKILLQSLLNAENAGLRIKALYDLENLPAPEAVEALIFTLRNDPVPTVRLSAFDILVSLPENPAVETAILETLREDVAVELRLRALDYLAGRKIDPALIHRSIESGPAESRPALLVRARQILTS